MPAHTETRIVPYTSEQLFDLVMDIEKYPEFLPWCIDAKINKVSKNNLDADITIGYKFFRENFSSRVHFVKNKEIDIEYIKGPMQHLHNKWKFKDLKNGECEVEFFVDFSFKTRFFESVIEQFFDRVLVKMINSFEERASDLYKD